MDSRVKCSTCCRVWMLTSAADMLIRFLFHSVEKKLIRELSVCVCVVRECVLGRDCIHIKKEQECSRCSRCVLTLALFSFDHQRETCTCRWWAEGWSVLVEKGHTVKKKKDFCIRLTCFFRPTVSQQDIWSKDQDHQRLPWWGCQLHPIPPSDVSLCLPSDWPACLYTGPRGLHLDSDCGGQGFSRGWTIWGHVPGNRWDAHTHTHPLLSLAVLHLTRRGR